MSIDSVGTFFNVLRERRKPASGTNTNTAIASGRDSGISKKHNKSTTKLMTTDSISSPHTALDESVPLLPHPVSQVSEVEAAKIRANLQRKVLGTMIIGKKIPEPIYPELFTRSLGGMRRLSTSFDGREPYGEMTLITRQAFLSITDTPKCVKVEISEKNNDQTATNELPYHKYDQTSIESALEEVASAITRSDFGDGKWASESRYVHLRTFHPDLESHVKDNGG